MSLFVILEHDRGALAQASEEALTAGRALAEDLDTEMVAVAIGAGASEVLTDAARYGAGAAIVVEHDLLHDYGPEAWGQAVVELIESEAPLAVMAVGTDRGNEVLAQTAARLDLPFVANVTEATPGELWELTRLQWGGSLLEDVTLEAGTPLLTIGHHVVEAIEAPIDASSMTVSTIEVELDEALARTIVVDRVVQEAGVTLSTARLVVSGGRGVGAEDGFAPLDELAELLGGRVGCSRAVTNNGWRPHRDQVGQTGTRIAPDLYIACGISGAIQHWVGAMASKQILAINTDPQANMVVKADYAVLGDLHKVVPAIVAEVKRRRS